MNCSTFINALARELTARGHPATVTGRNEMVSALPDIITHSARIWFITTTRLRVTDNDYDSPWITIDLEDPGSFDQLVELIEKYM